MNTGFCQIQIYMPNSKYIYIYILKNSLLDNTIWTDNILVQWPINQAQIPANADNLKMTE